MTGRNDLDPLDPDALSAEGHWIDLAPIGDQRPAAHVFERDAVLAVRAALACGRPLLVRGEPGVGKSQLARAVAKQLGRVFLSKFVDARTDVHELLWFHDAITRLAEAQAWGHRIVAGRPRGAAATGDRSAGSEPEAAIVAVDLARKRYVVPGPLWWALNWQSARDHVRQAEVKVPEPRDDGDPEKGVVLLVDEIDKADSSVPNGLLECLGQGMFSVPGLDEPIAANEPLPLVVFSSNDDRTLPSAFVRRCVVLWLRLPREQDRLVEWLVDRGHAHFGARKQPKRAALLPSERIREAAVQVARDRDLAHTNGQSPPGLAEYIDLLAVLAKEPSRTIDDYAPFLLSKHADPGPRDER
jgi:MoxR-like ATPase